MNKNRLKITSTETAVRDILREALAITPGTHEKGNDDKSFLSTVPKELPVSPSDHSSMQLSIQRPPVEDPDFVPASPKELARSLEALAQLVPNSAVEKFYQEFITMIDRYIDEENEKRFGIENESEDNT